MPESDPASGSVAGHWDAAYSSRGVEGVRWYQQVPLVSLELVEALGIPRDASVLDAGGGGSFLANELVARGFNDVAVLDLSAEALAATRRQLPPGAPVRCVHADLLEWTPDRAYGLWHDRATFNFLLVEGDRRRYLNVLRAATAPGTHVVVGTFAPDAPARCSGLPVVRYSADDLAAVLGGAGFEPVATRREEHVTPRGVVQPFTWVAGRLAGP